MIFFIRAVGWLFDIMFYVILLDVILSWVPQIRNNAFGRIVHQMASPILNPCRNLVHKIFPSTGMMPIDFSPIVAVVVLELIRGIVIRLLAMLL